MVVFIDLDADTVERDFPGSGYHYMNLQAAQMQIPHYARPHHQPDGAPTSGSRTSPNSRSRARKVSGKGKERAVPGVGTNDSPRLQSLFRVIGIYPCIRSIVQHLDQTDLYNLSSSCRDMHQSLLENRRHLLPFTLRCGNSGPNGANAKRSIPTSIRSPIVRTKCVSDLVNFCERCRKPSCRNCKSRSAKSLGQPQKRPTCTACSSVSLSMLTEDPTVRPCACLARGEPWVCNSCAVMGMENYLLKTDRHGRTIATVELECGRGPGCMGKGWYTCQNFYAYLDSAGKEEKNMKKGGKIRYACSGCKQFIFDKEEEKEFKTLRA